MIQNIMDSVRSSIRGSVEAAIGRLRELGELPPEAAPSVLLEVPKDTKFGEFATPVAMLLAKPARKAPRDIAALIVRELMGAENRGYIESAEIAGPGFINFTLSRRWLSEAVELIRTMGAKYGESDYGQGEKVLVEFVSANPVGPLNVVNARAAAVGDSLVRLLRAAGYSASSEFYVNDAGNQVGVLTESVYARYMELTGVDCPFPEDGYRGEYVRDVARAAAREAGARLSAMSPEQAREFLREFALSYMLRSQSEALARYGVRFDRWFSERELRATGAVETMLQEMEAAGNTYQAEGATWFRSSAFGDDKDRVLVKSDGFYTYVAPDLAYHRDKIARGFVKLIDILGPDHHGYEGRMQAGLKSFGCPDGTLEVIILQLVTLMREGQPVKMSKRAGEFITIDDLLEEVPSDAARYFFIMRNTSSHLEFDLDLARAQTMDNPVWYIQYAHARACSIFRQAESTGIEDRSWNEADLSLLASPREEELIRKMAAFPDEVLGAAIERAPSRIARYALELAGLFQSFYTDCRVIGEDDGLTRSRLALVDAARTVLASVLHVMGVGAPERM
ncbi:MAG: arginine--tRNA ligase [Clostridia bacterium]|nr:arginine--tRNA ligase [Clostridia bacterium]